MNQCNQLDLRNLLKRLESFSVDWVPHSSIRSRPWP